MKNKKGIPEGDLWRLRDNDPNSQNYTKEFIFDFTRIHIDDLRQAIKHYIWVNYRSGQRRLKGLRETFRRLEKIDMFMLQQGVSLRELNASDMDDLQSFLKVNVWLSNGKTMSYQSQRACFGELRSLINWCRVYKTECAPKGEIFTGREYTSNYSKVKIEYIPDEMFDKIERAIQEESNVYLKNGLIILKNTGMRLGDLVLLKRDCMIEHPINGKVLSWFDHKNQKMHVSLPINAECAKAIATLTMEANKHIEYAREHEKNNLFLYRPTMGNNTAPVVTVSRQVFTKWCAEFCEDHDIRDESGNLYRITTHMFRRTLGTDMFSKGANLKVIQELLGHADPTTTKKYYADVKNDEYKEMFQKIGILGSIHELKANKVFGAKDVQWVMDNKDGCARLEDGYCTLPIKNGQPCSKIMSKLKCYRCQRYVTTVADLDVHKQRLRELEHMLDTNIYGEHFASHIWPSVLILREIIRRLEMKKNGDTQTDRKQ